MRSGRRSVQKAGGPRELGPDYDDALLDSFVDRAEAQLRRRLDNDRPVAQRTPAPTQEPVQVTLGPGGIALVLVNGGWGVLSSLILGLTATGSEGGSTDLKLLLVWIVVAVADAAYVGALIARRADERGQQQRSAPPRAPGRRPAPGQSARRPTSS